MFATGMYLKYLKTYCGDTLALKPSFFRRVMTPVEKLMTLCLFDLNL